tara:strand:- start:5479 stop:6597 length:1119 start_codon:yes stop_codon:yes gene_type:complete
MAWYDFITEAATNTGKDLLTVGKNIISPENLAQTGLLTLLKGGNKGDYLRNAGIGGLLGSLQRPKTTGQNAKLRNSQIQSKNQFQGGPKFDPRYGAMTQMVGNEGIGGLEDGLQTAAFTEGEMIAPTPTGGFSILDSLRDSLRGPTFEGGNPPRTGTYNQGDYTYVDKEVIDESTGRVTGYIRDYSTGAQDMRDLDKGYLRTLREGKTKPANFGIGTQGLLDLAADNTLSTQVNKAVLEYIFPKAFQTEAEAVDLANQDYNRQVAQFTKNMNLGGFNQKFSRDIAAKQNEGPKRFAATGGGISKLNDGGFVNRDGPINGPGTGTSDDIPAMLSDGEFVMTAEAVRNAGGGNRQKGTEVMYGIMNNLENGGRA